ncbi:hypothetical protein LIER_01963 [Lithospermum erythrorhizon]|uniref:Uncharacterized protein n=1 Tax=Lithospermum erythrorhizon TaxID=34254 RepID=A0AAV3NNI6_LITER
MEIDPPIVNVKVQKGKEQKLKAKGSKIPISTGTSGVERPVLDIMPLRSIHPVNALQEVVQDENALGKEDIPIIEERVSDSSATEVTDIADVSEPSVTSSVKDSKGKTVEPPNIFDEHVEINSGSGVDIDVDVRDMCRGHID